jgi:hypothetical protein
MYKQILVNSIMAPSNARQAPDTLPTDRSLTSVHSDVTDVILKGQRQILANMAHLLSNAYISEPVFMYVLHYLKYVCTFSSKIKPKWLYITTTTRNVAT